MKTPHRTALMLAPVFAVAVAVSTLFWVPSGSGEAGHPALSALSWSPVAQAEPAKPDKKATRGAELIELEVQDVIPIIEADTHAVVLTSTDGQLMLPIFVTEEAAVSIAFRLAERTSPHPLAADLLDDVVKQLGGNVTEVRIDNVEDDIYTSHIIIRQGKKDLTLNARPSDAIAMALTGRAKIFCSQKVMAEAGISHKEIEALREEMGVGGGGEEGQEAPAPIEPQDEPGQSVPSLPEDENIRL